MKFTILTLFPEYFAGGVFGCSILQKAIEKGLLQIECVNIRDFATDKHQTVDDRPFGGGLGMVMMAEPLVKAIRSVRTENARVIYLTPQGQPLRAKFSEQLATTEEHLILLCGHYEGIDQRVIDLEVDDEISIGDYVVMSGNVASLVLIETVSRFVDGVIGNPDGAFDDSFHTEGGFEGPLYTRPQVYEGLTVPQVLLGGHHADIEKWRQEMGKRKKQRRDYAIVNATGGKELS